MTKTNKIAQYAAFVLISLGGLAVGWAVAGVVVDGNKAAPDLRVGDLCRTLQTHVPDADVAFKPRTDGRPADLNPSPIQVPDVLDVPVTVDLANRLGITPPVGLEMKATLGFLQIHKDGRVLYNGEDISTRAYTECKQKEPAHEQPGSEGKQP